VGAGVNIITIILTSGRVGLGAKLINQARVWSILQPKVWCCGGCGAGISYIQALAWCLAWC
jgi:hypothetical protein